MLLPQQQLWRHEERVERRVDHSGATWLAGRAASVPWLRAAPRAVALGATFCCPLLAASDLSQGAEDSRGIAAVGRRGEKLEHLKTEAEVRLQVSC